MLLNLAIACLGTVGVDVSQPVSQESWSCLTQPGGQGPIEFAVARVYRSGGSVDPNGAATIRAAREAGIKYVDGYIFPCATCGSPEAQVNATKAALDAAGAIVGMLWYDVETYEWPADQTANRKFVAGLIEAGDALGVTAGIYSGERSWSAIVGNWTYASDRGMPLWYAHYDGVAAFSDFTPFAGWTAPSIKQYLGSHESCGAGVDYNWYP